MFASSPRRAGGYISEEAARSLCAALRRGGCRSVHIGGGEPFLDTEGLVRLARIAHDAGITVEYVETNAFWVKSKSAAAVLEQLMQASVDTLCISIDPFHAEYVPYERPLQLAELCERAGMGYFLWRSEFLSTLKRLDPSKTHTRAEMAGKLSKDYVKKIADAYGVGYKGRALNIELEYTRRAPVEKLLAGGRPCGRLTSGGHFHADLYGRYVPPGCTGLSLPLDEAISGLPAGKYPVYEALCANGAEGILRYAEERGFKPDPGGYTSACALCFFIRRWLVENAPSPELDAEYYQASMEYY